MRNNIVRNMFLTFVALTMGACSNDLPGLQDYSDGNGSQKVSISINGISKDKTRALTEEQAAALKAKEDAIDPDRIYAVVFDNDGNNGKTYKLTKGDDDRYDFNIDTKGNYKFFMVANTNEVNENHAVFATENDLFAVIENDRPATETTQFVMTTDEVALEVTGAAAVTSKDVTLKRAVARIDVESFEGFTISSILVENRYLGTKIARVGDDKDMTGLTRDAEDAENDDDKYKKTYNFSNVTEVIGQIYTYENLSTTDHVKLTIHGTTIEGERDIVVTFDGDGVLRNHAYKVTINNTGVSYDQLGYAIEVADWTAGSTLVWSGTKLTDNVTPDVYVTTADANYINVLGGTTVSSETRNPSEIWIQPSGETSKTVTLRVVGSSVGSSVVKATGTHADAPEAVAGAITHTDDGKVQQTFTITIPSTLLNKELVYNVYNKVAGDVSKQAIRIVARLDYSLLAVGDIIYKDGRFSTNYDATIAAGGNDPVAIVFSTTVSTYDSQKAQNGIYGFRAYAMSLKESSKSVKWSAATMTDVDAIPGLVRHPATGLLTGGDEGNWKDVTADMDGLKNTQAIWAAGNASVYPAAWNAKNFAIAAPWGTSGWYLPSAGQHYLWITTAFGEMNSGNPNCEAIAANTVDGGRYMYWGGAAIATRDAINNFITTTKGVPAEMFDAFEGGGNSENPTWSAYWSSTLRAIKTEGETAIAGYPFILSFNTGGGLYLHGYYPSTSGYRVRPVFAL